LFLSGKLRDTVVDTELQKGPQRGDYMSAAYDLLIARDEIFQLMVKSGHGFDLRDKELVRSIFADSFELDYSD
jgi:hypothetical protein